jgi:hypothetical protein
MSRLSFFIIVISFFKTSYAQHHWTCMGDPIMPTNTFVVGFEYYKNDLYAYTYPYSPLFKLTASNNWQAVYPVPLSGGIHRVRVIDTTLYVASYASSSQQYVYYLQNNAWQQKGNSFRNVGSSQTPNLYDIISYNNEIYVCGEFNRVGTDTVLGIAKWNGTKWIGLGTGLSGKMPPNTSYLYPHNMLIYQNKLHVTGNFINAGGIPVNGIAAWDGTNWSPVGSGFNNVGYGMGEFNGELYTGGEFTEAGGIPVSVIAKWDGQTWAHTGMDFNYLNSPNDVLFVHTLENINNKLFIAGGFNNVVKNGTSYSCGSIISFDGNAIDTMLGGVNKYVEGITLFQNSILIGGNFSMVNDTACQAISLYTNVTEMKENTIIHSNACLVPTLCNNQIVLIGDITGLKYSLTDLSGKVVQSGVANNTIPLNQIQNGCYILHLTGSKYVVSKK